MEKETKNISDHEEERTDLEKEIEQARKEGKSEAWIRMNLDI